MSLFFNLSSVANACSRGAAAAGALLRKQRGVTTLCLAAFPVVLACSSAQDASPEGSAKSAQSLIRPAPIPAPGLGTYGWNTSWTNADTDDGQGHVPFFLSWGNGRADLFEKDNTLDGHGYISQKITDANGNWAPSAVTRWSLWPRSSVRSEVVGVGYDAQYVDLFFRGDNDNLIRYYWDGAWKEENLGGTMLGKPAASHAHGRTDVFAVGTDHQLYHRGKAAFDTTFQDWDRLGIYSAPSDPVAVAQRSSRIDVFFRNPSGSTIFYTWQVERNGIDSIQGSIGSGAFTGPTSLDGIALDIPTVASSSDNHMDVFVPGTDDSIQHRSFANGVWSNWAPIGGCMYGQAAATSMGPDRVDLIVKSKADGRLLYNWYGYQPSTRAGDAPVCCGHDGQSCCPGYKNSSAVCNDGGEACVGAVCKHVGGDGEPCLDGGSCNDPSSLACGGDQRCHPCGGENQGCCAGNACTGDGACNANGLCHACGRRGLDCCPGLSVDQSCSRDRSVCLVGNKCGDCGRDGQYCCPNGEATGNAGGAPSACYGSLGCNRGVCGTCGAVGQACCSGTSCNDGFFAECKGGTCVKVGGPPPAPTCPAGRTCGAPGCPCCDGSNTSDTGNCDPGVAVCQGTTCVACGGRNQNCCKNGGCNTGTCTGGNTCP